MSHPRFILLSALVLSAALQAALLVERPSDHRLAGLEPVMVGQPMSLPDSGMARGSLTVLLAFRSDCRFCQLSAAPWGEWLRHRRGDVEAIAISTEEEATARAFADAHDWNVPVVTVDTQSPSSQLLLRTPWIWVVGPGDTLLYQGHGADLDRLDEALLWLGQESS